MGYYGLQGNRHFFAKTLFRVVTPVREVTWSDFLLADILTSLAKALSDSERALCHMMAGPIMVPHASQQVQHHLAGLPQMKSGCPCMELRSDWV